MSDYEPVDIPIKVGKTTGHGVDAGDQLPTGVTIQSVSSAVARRLNRNGSESDIDELTLEATSIITGLTTGVDGAEIRFTVTCPDTLPAEGIGYCVFWVVRSDTLDDEVRLPCRFIT